MRRYPWKGKPDTIINHIVILQTPLRGAFRAAVGHHSKFVMLFWCPVIRFVIVANVYMYMIPSYFQCCCSYGSCLSSRACMIIAVLYTPWRKKDLRSILLTSSPLDVGTGNSLDKKTCLKSWILLAIKALKASMI